MMASGVFDTTELEGLFARNSKLVGDLLKRATNIQTKITKAEEVKGLVTDLNSISGRRSVDVLTGKDASKNSSFGLNEDWYIEMLSDNQQLKKTLSKFQSGTDLIMMKHREQTMQMMTHINKLQAEADANIETVIQKNNELRKEIADLKSREEKHLQIMSLAVVTSEEYDNNQNKELERLRIENKGLRELLGIAGIPSPGYEDENN